MNNLLIAITVLTLSLTAFANRGEDTPKPDVLITAGSNTSNGYNERGNLNYIRLTVIADSCENEGLKKLLRYTLQRGETSSMGFSGCGPVGTYKKAVSMKMSWVVKSYGSFEAEDYEGADVGHAQEAPILDRQIQATTLQACEKTEQSELAQLKRKSLSVIHRTGCLERTKEVGYIFTSIIYYRYTACSVYVANVEAKGGECSSMTPGFTQCIGKNGNRFALMANTKAKTGCSIHYLK